MENGEIKTNGAVTVTNDYAVVVADKEGLQAFFAGQKNLETLYAAVEKKALGLVADTSTKEGRSQIKTAARQLASVKKKVDDIGKQVVAELKALPNVIDDNRKKWRESMEALQDEIRKPVTEIEEREKAVEAICNTHLNLAFAGSAEIEAEIKKLEETPLTEEKWKESLKDATLAISGEINALKVLRDAALKKEEDARQLEELKAKQAEAERIIREQKIKEEAERRAKEEAEARAAAEKARLEREKAEAERRAAEAERKAQEAKERAEMEKRAVESKNGNALDDCKAPHSTVSSPATASRPSAWTQEQKDVNNAVVAAIAAILPQHLAGFTDKGYELAAKGIVKAVLTGRIAHLKVEYK